MMRLITLGTGTVAHTAERGSLPGRTVPLHIVGPVAI